MTGNWFGQSLIAMILLIPSWLAVGFFERNYQIKSDVYIVWFFLGMAVTPALFGSPLALIAPSWRLIGAMLLIGITIGGVANVLLFRAVITAPNPGLPVAISNAASVGVFLAAALLARLMPNYFNAVKVDGVAFLGVAFVMTGVSIIAFRR
ncbi:MAG: hypothetical protein Q7S89_02195 [bacterium]|nr:hypothetical protein [bacterium]